MKTRPLPRESISSRQQRRAPRRRSRAAYRQRITQSWIINALVIPLSIALLSQALALLLAQWGK